MTSTDLIRLLGAHAPPTDKGWWNFNHRKCGDKRLRLGVHFTRGRFRCFNCGDSGSIADLIPGLKRGEIAPPARPKIVRPLPNGLPWKALAATGDLTVTGEATADYLARRGVPRAHAARLGLGYGTEGRWIGRVIHPYLDLKGDIAGWQGRLLRDPDDDETTKKTLFAKASDLPRGLTLVTPSQGALYLIDRVPKGSPVIVNEGPYDAIHAERVAPAVALFGSVMSEGQMRRLLARRPSAIYLALDRDKSGPWWNADAARWMPDPRGPILRALYARTEAPVYIVTYPAAFDGDFGGHDDKTPHSTSELSALVSSAVQYRPGTPLPQQATSRRAG